MKSSRFSFELLRERNVKLMSRLLASVNIFVEKSQKEKVLLALSELSSIEEVYEVAGEYDIVSVVSVLALKSSEMFYKRKS